MSVALPPRSQPPRTAVQIDPSALSRIPKRVECVAWEYQPERYRALCLEFSLVAESAVSMLDAQRRLEAQILDYLREVIAEGCPDHLVNRGLSRRERCELWLEIKKIQIRGWLAEKFSHTVEARRGRSATRSSRG